MQPGDRLGSARQQFGSVKRGVNHRRINRAAVGGGPERKVGGDELGVTHLVPQVAREHLGIVGAEMVVQQPPRRLGAQ